MADNDEISPFHCLHARNTITPIPTYALMAEASFINFAVGQTQGSEVAQRSPIQVRSFLAKLNKIDRGEWHW